MRLSPTPRSKKPSPGRSAVSRCSRRRTDAGERRESDSEVRPAGVDSHTGVEDFSSRRAVKKSASSYRKRTKLLSSLKQSSDYQQLSPSEKRLSYRSSSISSDAIGFALCNAEPNIPLQRPRSRLSAMAGDVAELKLDALNMIVLLEHARALFGSIIR